VGYIQFIGVCEHLRKRPGYERQCWGGPGQLVANLPPAPCNALPFVPLAMPCRSSYLITRLMEVCKRPQILAQ
jgi:hypothetical protein